MAGDRERILLVTWNYPPKVGGIENLLSQLVNEISSAVEVDVVAPFAEQNENDKGYVYRPDRGGLLWFFGYALVQGFRILISKNVNVIWGGSALLTPVVFLLGKITNTPVIVHTYGLDLTYQNSIYQFFIKNLLPRVNQVIAISEETKNKAHSLGVSDENISLIHPGIHAAAYNLKQDPDVLKEKYDLSGKKVLLYAGRLAKRKGLHEFVRHAFPEIIRQHPDVILCIVGGNPDNSLMHKENIRQMIEDDVEELNLTSHVRFFGWVDRQVLLELYSACDVFILPAIHVPGDMEGFGIVLAEANAAGKPVVSSRIGGIPDAVVDGRSVILLEPGDWRAYQNAVINLLDHHSLREELGRFGADHAGRELDWKVIGDQFLERIHDLC